MQNKYEDITPNDSFIQENYKLGIHLNSHIFYLNQNISIHNNYKMKKNFKTLLNFILIAGIIMIFTHGCKKDNDTNDLTQSGTVKDIDSNV